MNENSIYAGDERQAYFELLAIAMNQASDGIPLDVSSIIFINISSIRPTGFPLCQCSNIVLMREGCRCGGC